MIKRILLSFFILFYTTSLFSQKKMTSEDYINKYYKISVRQMKEFKIPASITLAQGILESGNGNSDLAQNAKNHFGIKCHKDWKGKGYYMDDDAKNECFRVYKSPEESFKDHSLFLSKRGRYEFLFTDYKTTDYKKWAHGLKKAGYATNPKYPQLLIDIIERNKLYEYDNFNLNVEEEKDENLIALEESDDENYIIEETDEYIKALMGRNVYYSNAKKGIFVFNRIKTIKAKNRTPLEIAIEYKVHHDQILKYNDINASDLFSANQNVFLQPKRFKGSQKKYLVKPGDSMWEISQMFGIKLNSLYKKNLMQIGEEVKPGETLNLKKKREKKVLTISYQEVLRAKRSFEESKPKKEVLQKSNTQETTININIIDKTENKAITIEKEEVQEKIYPDHKYTDKNEEMEKVEEKNPVSNNSNVLIHIVEQGETLYFLSKKYNVDIEDLKKANNLKDNSIDIGQELIILQKQ